MPAEESHERTVVIVTGAAPLDCPRRRRHPEPTRSCSPPTAGSTTRVRRRARRPAGLIGDLDSVSEEGSAWAEHARHDPAPPDRQGPHRHRARGRVRGRDEPVADRHDRGGGDRLDHSLAAIGALGAPVLTSVPLDRGWWGGQHLQVLHGPARVTIRLRRSHARSRRGSRCWRCTGRAPASRSPGPDGRSNEVDARSARRPRPQQRRDRTPDIELAIVDRVLTVFVDPRRRRGAGHERPTSVRRP